MLGSVIVSNPLSDAATEYKLKFIDFTTHVNIRTEDFNFSDALSDALLGQKEFLHYLQTEKLDAIVGSLRGFIHENSPLVYSYWATVFPFFWNILNGNERHDAVKDIIALVAHDYHSIQADFRPNVIQAILEGACKCSPSLPLPPQLVRCVILLKLDTSVRRIMHGI